MSARWVEPLELSIHELHELELLVSAAEKWVGTVPVNLTKVEIVVGLESSGRIVTLGYGSLGEMSVLDLQWEGT